MTAVDLTPGALRAIADGLAGAYEVVCDGTVGRLRPAADALHALADRDEQAAKSVEELREAVEKEREACAQAAEGPVYDIYGDGSTPSFRGNADGNWTFDSDYGRGRLRAAEAIRSRTPSDQPAQASEGE